MKRGILFTVATIFTAFFLTMGTYIVVDTLAIETHRSSKSFDPVPAVVLDVRGGGLVTVVGDGGDGVRVDFTVREGLKSGSADAHVDADGNLKVSTRCPDFFNLYCRVTVTVHVPQGTSVRGGGDSPVDVTDVKGPIDLRVENGSTRITGAEGLVTVRSGNGSVSVADSTGDLHVSTDNGSIRTDSIDASTVVLSTSNGSVNLDLSVAPQRIEATTDNGRVRIGLPEGSPAYATQTSTDNGSIDVAVSTDPGSDRTITAKTDNGSISIYYR